MLNTMLLVLLSTLATIGLAALIWAAIYFRRSAKIRRYRKLLNRAHHLAYVCRSLNNGLGIDRTSAQLVLGLKNPIAVNGLFSALGQECEDVKVTGDYVNRYAEHYYSADSPPPGRARRGLASQS